METVIKIFTDGSKGGSERKDDDWVDRLNSKYTVILFIVFAVVVSTQIVIFKPITCWAPKHFTKAHTKYTDAYCWVKNTYYLPFEDEIPAEDEPEKRQMIPYYQWIPFILLTQALMFYAPSVLWHGYNQRAGVDADTILGVACTIDNAKNVERRGDKVMMIRNQMDRFLTNRHKPVIKKTKAGEDNPDGGTPDKKRSNMAGLRAAIVTRQGTSSRRFGCYLIVLYIITKVLYLVNVIGQLYLLNAILSVDYNIYGLEVLQWMLSNYDWTTSPQVAFPRVTMCDFKVRRLGNVHRYTVQCTLPINLYNEKIYMFLWFWMVFVAICTTISLVTWIARAAIPTDREKYVRNHLTMAKKLKVPADETKMKSFLSHYLRLDGVFLLRLIGHNTNTMTVSDIIGALWDNYKPVVPPKPSAPPPIKSTLDEDMEARAEKEPLDPMTAVS